MRFSILVVLLSLFAVTASAQQADTTATAVQQQADTAAVVAPPQTTAPPQATTPPPPQTTTPPPTSASQPGRSRWLGLGAGIHYLKTVGDIKDTPEFEDDAYNIVGSVQVVTGLFKFEGDVEWIDDYGGSGEALWLPQVFVLVGGLIYGGAGIGTGYTNSEWFDKPFYALRAGVDIPLGRFGVDVNANYRFMDTGVFEDADTEDLDSITFGAIVRLWL